jgi:rhomboid family GlyGly-CTERM serine protease
LLSVIVYNSPALKEVLAYDRLKVVTAGEWWRLFTGSFVHFSGRELVLNAAVLLPAGVWAERVSPGRARALWLLAPLLVGGVVYGFLPDVGRFAGLSGLAAGMVAFLALAQLRTESGDRWFWRGVLVLLALKIGAEAVLASRLMSTVPDPTRRAEALIHLAGMSAGAMMLSARRRKR